jgi:hypothetical protein
MIGYFKNDLFKNGHIKLSDKKRFESMISHLNYDWANQYEFIRNKFSAHHQDAPYPLLIEWWNQIDYTTITYFYAGMQEIRSLLTTINISTITPTDFEEIDFSGTCISEKDAGAFYVSHDRLALTKENTVGMVSQSSLHTKCMLLLSIVDFIFINLALTVKTELYNSVYKKILFDTGWLLTICDTVALIDNMYEDDSYGLCLLSVSPTDWKGLPIIMKEKASRNITLESNLRAIRNTFAAHIDTQSTFESLCASFEQFDLCQLHSYMTLHMQAFQRACFSDMRTNMFVHRDLKLSAEVVGLAYSCHKNVND